MPRWDWIVILDPIGKTPHYPYIGAYNSIFSYMFIPSFLPSERIYWEQLCPSWPLHSSQKDIINYSILNHNFDTYCYKEAQDTVSLYTVVQPEGQGKGAEGEKEDEGNHRTWVFAMYRTQWARCSQIQKCCQIMSCLWASCFSLKWDITSQFRNGCLKATEHATQSAQGTNGTYQPTRGRLAWRSTRQLELETSEILRSQSQLQPLPVLALCWVSCSPH